MYGFTTPLTAIGLDPALSRTIEALQGATKDQPVVERPPCRILGASHPKLAHQALQAVPDSGLLLPAVRAIGDAAEPLLRHACVRRTTHRAPARAA
ncbi:MAG: DUF302 domain-containing protein [Rhodoferax sp.]|nr:DUF302 domain-containing protein [Rhodoferax sp.]